MGQFECVVVAFLGLFEHVVFDPVFHGLFEDVEFDSGFHGLFAYAFLGENWMCNKLCKCGIASRPICEELFCNVERKILQTMQILERILRHCMKNYNNINVTNVRGPLGNNQI